MMSNVYWGQRRVRERGYQTQVEDMQDMQIPPLWTVIITNIRALMHRCGDAMDK